MMYVAVLALVAGLVAADLDHSGTDLTGCDGSVAADWEMIAAVHHAIAVRDSATRGLRIDGEPHGSVEGYVTQFESDIDSSRVWVAPDSIVVSRTGGGLAPLPPSASDSLFIGGVPYRIYAVWWDAFDRWLVTSNGAITRPPGGRVYFEPGFEASIPVEVGKREYRVRWIVAEPTLPNQSILTVVEKWFTVERSE